MNLAVQNERVYAGLPSGGPTGTIAAAVEQIDSLRHARGLPRRPPGRALPFRFAGTNPIPI